MDQALPALDAIMRAVTRWRPAEDDDDEDGASAASASSSASGGRRGRTLELNFQSETLKAMGNETTAKNLLLLLGQDSQDMKLAIRALTVSYKNTCK